MDSSQWAPHILNRRGSQLQEIFDKVAHLSTINAALKKVVPPPLNEHCCVANLEAGCLTIETESAVWATPLRFQLPAILQKLQPLVGLYRIEKMAL